MVNLNIVENSLQLPLSPAKARRDDLGLDQDDMARSLRRRPRRRPTKLRIF
jgi:hypothetical protein